MTEIFVNLSEENDNSKKYSIFSGFIFIVLGIIKIVRQNNSTSTNFTLISSLLFIITGLILIVIGSSKRTPKANRYIKISNDIIEYKLSSWGKKKEINWNELSVIQLNNKMIKVDYKDNVRFELFDLSITNEENIKTVTEAFSILAKEKGIKII